MGKDQTYLMEMCLLSMAKQQNMEAQELLEAAIQMDMQVAAQAFKPLKTLFCHFIEVVCFMNVLGLRVGLLLVSEYSYKNVFR